MLENMNGWIIIDKEVGVSSAQIVSKVKRIFCEGDNSKKIKFGHAGTLDPAASGVLPIAVGRATKTISYVVNSIKEYFFTIKFGELRDTGDIEGKIISENTVRPSKESLASILNRFQGVILQTPPIYSAVKIKGHRSYSLARNGQIPELVAREVKIETLKLLNVSEDNNYAEFFVRCGKGTYIRSLAVDIAKEVGCYGYVSKLRRSKVGNFSQELSISITQLSNSLHDNNYEKVLIPMNTVLDDILVLKVNDDQFTQLKHGKYISYSLPELTDRTVVRILHNDQLVALGEFENDRVKVLRLLN